MTDTQPQGYGKIGASIASAWTATPTTYVCQGNENGGSTNFGIGSSVATTTGFNITSAVSVVAATFTVNYSCVPSTAG